jgi:hypothetical protein
VTAAEAEKTLKRLGLLHTKKAIRKFLAISKRAAAESKPKRRPAYKAPLHPVGCTCGSSITRC